MKQELFRMKYENDNSSEFVLFYDKESNDYTLELFSLRLKHDTMQYEWKLNTLYGAVGYNNIISYNPYPHTRELAFKREMKLHKKNNQSSLVVNLNGRSLVMTGAMKQLTIRLEFSVYEELVKSKISINKFINQAVLEKITRGN